MCHNSHQRHLWVFELLRKLLGQEYYSESLDTREGESARLRWSTATFIVPTLRQWNTSRTLIQTISRSSQFDMLKFLAPIWSISRLVGKPSRVSGGMCTHRLGSISSILANLEELGLLLLTIGIGIAASGCSGDYPGRWWTCVCFGTLAGNKAYLEHKIL